MVRGTGPESHPNSRSGLSASGTSVRDCSLEAHTFIGLRTHYIDDGVRRFASRLMVETPFEFALLVDEACEGARVEGLPKIAIDPTALDALGLYRNFEAPGWRCGDYALYLARQQFPACQYYWVTEPDVRINVAHLSEFFDMFSADSSDLIVSQLRLAEDGWYWRRSMETSRYDVYRCFFPLVRISGEALDFLAAERRRRAADARCRDLWPNDEAFVATVLKHGGFRCRDLNEFGNGPCSSETFTFDRPIAEADFKGLGFDGKVYHPVLGGDRLFKKLLQNVKAGGSPQHALEEVSRLIGIEWSETEAHQYLAQMAAIERPRSLFGRLRSWFGRDLAD